MRGYGMREHYLKRMLADWIAALVGDDKELKLMVAERLLEGTESRSSRIVESHPHGDGWLHLETRINPKTGTERGPYWYYRHVSGGRQRSVYIGKKSLEEAKEVVDRVDR
jgi:hypothetical protein